MRYYDAFDKYNLHLFMMHPKIKLFLSTLFFASFHSALCKIDFVRDVKPILEHNCVSCHREDNAKGKVRLDDKVSAFAGDDVIVPGKPEDSSLYWTTTLPVDDELFMPPIKNEEKDYPLTDSEKKILSDWIKEGADWPDEEKLVSYKRLPKKIDFVEHVQPILELNCVSVITNKRSREAPIRFFRACFCFRNGDRARGAS